MRETLDRTNEQTVDLTKTDHDPDRSLVLSHFLTNFLQNLASCHTALRLPLIKYFKSTLEVLNKISLILKISSTINY
jgi:hypothetical protein